MILIVYGREDGFLSILKLVDAAIECLVYDDSNGKLSIKKLIVIIEYLKLLFIHLTVYKALNITINIEEIDTVPLP